jgi:uncharacterized protein YndB with AHSA1/START domain
MEDEVLLDTANYELITTRNVLASVDAVFKAWTDPVHLRNWWGPRRFSNTFLEFDLRQGGKWRFIMHGPGKNDYPHDCEFMEIAPPELIAWKHVSDPPFLAVVNIRAVTKRITNVTFCMRFDDAEQLASIKHYTMFKHEEAFDRLENELEVIEPQSPNFKARK